MGAAAVNLRAMRQDEYDAYSQERDRDYVESIVRARSAEAAAEAADLARRGREQFLPQGLATERHHLLVAEDADGRVVGRVWLGLDEPRTGSADTAWLYDIRVEPAHRRAGYGTAILQAVETLARDAGARQLGLNVFGDNAAAIALYEAVGYEVTTQQMAKRLR